MTTEQVAASRRGAGAVATRTFATLVLLGLVLGALAGAGAGLARGDRYTGTSTVLVAPLVGNPFTSQTDNQDLVKMFTEAQLVSSDDVVSRVVSVLGGTLNGQRAGLSVEVPSNTQLLRISVSDTEPERANQRSRAFADAFLAYREDQASKAIASQRGSIRQEREGLQSTQSSLLDQFRAAPSDAQRAVIQERLAAISAQLIDLNAEATRLDGERSAGQVITPALDATTLPVPIVVLGAVVGGLVCALVVALGVSAWSARRSRISG